MNQQWAVPESATRLVLKIDSELHQIPRGSVTSSEAASSRHLLGRTGHQEGNPLRNKPGLGIPIVSTSEESTRARAGDAESCCSVISSGRHSTRLNMAGTCIADHAIFLGNPWGSVSFLLDNTAPGYDAVVCAQMDVGTRHGFSGTKRGIVRSSPLFQTLPGLGEKKKKKSHDAGLMAG